MRSMPYSIVARAVLGALGVPKAGDLFDTEPSVTAADWIRSPGKSSFLTRCRFRNGFWVGLKVPLRCVLARCDQRS
jgi:hypothetical protein